jgi:hypothetical protein
VGAGRDASNNTLTCNFNTLTCNFGLTPEQLKQATEAAVKGATGPLIDRITDISKTLGVTEEAAKTLLRIVSEQSDVPDERLAEVLTKIANDYKRLQVQAVALNPDNPTARDLVSRAKTEIEAGRLAQAHELLRQATQVQIAAAQEARTLREQAQAAEDTQMSGAAESTATEADVALTERHYVDVGQAAGYVPARFRPPPAGRTKSGSDRRGFRRTSTPAWRVSARVEMLCAQGDISILRRHPTG